MAAAAHGELELSQLPSPPKIPETSTAHDPDIRSNGQYADAHCDAFSESQKLSEKEQQKLQKHIHTQQSVPVVDAAAASRAQGQKSLVEFWTKGQMKAHFRFAALFFVVVVSLTVRCIPLSCSLARAHVIRWLPVVLLAFHPTLYSLEV